MYISKVMRLRDNNNRKEVNDERIKEQLVKVQKGSEWVSTPKRNQNNKEVTVIPPHLKGIKN